MKLLIFACLFAISFAQTVISLLENNKVLELNTEGERCWNDNLIYDGTMESAEHCAEHALSLNADSYYFSWRADRLKCEIVNPSDESSMEEACTYDQYYNVPVWSIYTINTALCEPDCEDHGEDYSSPWETRCGWEDCAACSPCPVCDLCAQEYVSSGGCDCMLEQDCDEEALIPAVCGTCGPNWAAEACGIDVSTTSTTEEPAPTDGLCDCSCHSEATTVFNGEDNSCMNDQPELGFAANAMCCVTTPWQNDQIRMCCGDDDGEATPTTTLQTTDDVVPDDFECLYTQPICKIQKIFADDQGSETDKETRFFAVGKHVKRVLRENMIEDGSKPQAKWMWRQMKDIVKFEGYSRKSYWRLEKQFENLLEWYDANTNNFMG